MRRAWIAAAALLAGLTAPAAANACVNAVAAQPGTQAYDAAAAANGQQSFDVTFVDVCPALPAPRNVEVWFTDDVDPGAPRMIGGVPFDIRQGGVSYLFAPGERVSQPYALSFAPPSATRSFAFILYPGYDASAATRQIRMHWSTTDANGDPVENEQVLTLGLSIVPLFSLQMSGGGNGSMLDFGVLQPGARLSAQLNVRTSSAFTITATSQYSGALRRASPCGAPLGPAGEEAELVHYSATLNGRAIDEATPYADTNGDGASVRSIDGLPVEVTIDPALDPRTKRAGSYCDVLTLSIAPLN